MLRLVESADAVEQACLAGAVGTDDRQYLALFDLKADVEQRGYAAKAQLEFLDFKLCFACLKGATVEGVSESAQHIEAMLRGEALLKRYCGR